MAGNAVKSMKDAVLMAAALHLAVVLVRLYVHLLMTLRITHFAVMVNVIQRVQCVVDMEHIHQVPYVVESMYVQLTANAVILRRLRRLSAPLQGNHAVMVQLTALLIIQSVVVISAENLVPQFAYTQADLKVAVHRMRPVVDDGAAH